MSSESVRVVASEDAPSRLAEGVLRSFDQPEWRQARGSSAFGLFGPRGAGKTTALGRAMEILGSPERRRVVQVLETIDCSVLADDTDPGTALLVRMLANSNLMAELRKAKTNLEGRLRELVGSQSSADPAYRELYLELASRPEDYQRLVTDGLRKRYLLREQIGAWLDEACHHLSVGGFVVALDDFDLTPAALVRRWMRALLDELCQPRLAVILAADLHRLEHLSLHPAEGVDDRTGRALTDKVVPIGRRVELAPMRVGWHAFRPLDLERAPQQGRPAPTLGELLDRWCSDGLGSGAEHAAVRPQLEALMPERPRGLVAIYDVLAQHAEGDVGRPGAGASPLSSDDTARTERGRWAADVEMLGNLARGRGEHILARRLEDERVHDIAEGLVWGTDLPDVASWRHLCDQARRTPRSAPLLGIAPAVLEERATPDPQGLDPARREHSWRDQLRDAEREDRARWVELLLDLAGARSSDMRVLLAQRWPPARERLAGSRLRVAFDRYSLERFFLSEGDVRGLLPWIAVGTIAERGANLEMEIGWAPLIHALRGARDPWPADLLDRLNIGYAFVGVRGSVVEGAESIAFFDIPVRAQLLLLDALARCPWRALSSDVPSWRVSTHLRLAAALCEAAFTFAAVNARFGERVGDLIRELPMGGPRLLLTQILRREPLVPQLEKEAMDLLDELDAEPMLDVAVRLSEGGRSYLLDAHRAFTTLRAVRALRDLGPPWP